ncbi:MAG TPA: polymorphic toxin-type HINT domain-containing protein [Pirellulales bacterium]|nr:polymorphic toxin-type HINT domain-containing protein [Pirellulales bacterium]
MDAENRADRTGRDRLVEQALAQSPDFAPARWQAGQVRVQDAWATVDDAVAKGSHDELLAQYHKLRGVYGDSPEGQLTLARWCQKHHLADEMRAHATRLLTSRQDDPELLKMLDLVWHDGQLITTAEVADRKAQEESAKQALRHWRPLLVAIREKVESKTAEGREAGLKELAAVNDPAAIEALLAVFKKPASLCEALRVIGQMPGQEATDALLQQAILTRNEDVGLTACAQLKTRSAYGYVPKLLAALSTPVQSKFEVVHDADGVHFRETLRREGQESAVVKTVDTEVGLLTPNPYLGYIIGQAYQEAVLDTQANAKASERLNRKLLAYNDAIYRVLDHTVGNVAPHDPEAWWKWWYNYNVTSSEKKPSYVDNYYNPVAVPYVPVTPYNAPTVYVQAALPPPPPPPPPTPVLPPGMHWDVGKTACFARGTPVWTSVGPMPIENVQVGDRVLSQHPLSGELAFKPVLDITLGHRDFLAVDADSEQLVATPGHVFWVSGAGWRMTKELKAGDRLHTLSGWSEVRSIKPVDEGETHNLVVADFNTYFVGEDRILVHDITIPQMVTGGVPGELAIR